MELGGDLCRPPAPQATSGHTCRRLRRQACPSPRLCPFKGKLGKGSVCGAFHILRAGLGWAGQAWPRVLEYTCPGAFFLVPGGRRLCMCFCVSAQPRLQAVIACTLFPAPQHLWAPVKLPAVGPWLRCMLGTTPAKAREERCPVSGHLDSTSWTWKGHQSTWRPSCGCEGRWAGVRDLAARVSAASWDASTDVGPPPLCSF